MNRAMKSLEAAVMAAGQGERRLLHEINYKLVCEAKKFYNSF